ncbi:MAG: TonB-dependent receptor [Pedobacter sp.]|nr:TonB-dependent receptor [Pedobacter sp.]
MAISSLSALHVQAQEAAPAGPETTPPAGAESTPAASTSSLSQNESPAADATADTTTATSKPETAPVEARTLDAVVVTAQKRTQKLQEVPVPVTAIGGKSIREDNVVLSTDIERLAPNLSAQGGGRTGKPRWFLRGIGTNDPNQNQDGPLSIYVDEVVVGLQSNQSFPLFDLERVEVLRGPQGTLWGKNNTGGAIHFISKKPGFEDDGYTKLTYGSYNARIIESAYGGAIVDGVLAGRASFYYESSDGWAKNIATGNEGPTLKDFNGRFQLLANFSDTANAQLILSTRQVDSGDSPSYTVGATTQPGTDITVVNPGGAITQGGTTYYPPYGSNPEVDSPFWGGDGYNRVTYNNATLKFNWQLGSSTLTSISAYNTRDGDTLATVGAPLNTTLNRTSSTGSLDSQQFTQELRLTSAQDQRLTWILGAYYYDLQADNLSRSARFAVGTTSKQYSESSWNQDSVSAAVFGNTKFNFTDKAALTLGLRYTYEDKDITETALTVTGGGVTYVSENGWFLPGGVVLPASSKPTVVSTGADWGRVTWDVTPEYKFNKDLLGYARIATGFRSGGFNQSINNGSIYQTNPETLTDYELGLKSSWLDGRLTVNTALYHYDIESIQLNIQRAFYNTTTQTWTTSASGESDGEVTGIEVEVASVPLRGWNLGGSLGYLKSQYTDFTYTIGGAGPFDASGNEFYRTPEVSFRLDTDYTLEYGFGNVVLATDWSYRSSIYHNATVQNDPLQETPGYWIGNAHIAFQPHNREWEFSVFGNNLLGESPVYLRQIANPNTGTQPVSISAPQTWGVQTTFRF